MTLRKSAAALAAVLALGAPEASANLVVNGGFETSDFASWTQFGNTTGNTVGGTIYAHSGDYAARFQQASSAGTGGIFQDLIVAPLATYTIDFWLYNGGGTPNSFVVEFDGVTLYALVDSESIPSPYAHIVLSGQTDGDTTATLRFTALHNPEEWNLDDVGVTLIVTDGDAIPKPATLALLGLGIAGLGLARRRRA